ncbi:ATP-binding protein [Sedimenticola thiotaurini]|uniref:histidine kinase n=1 Tax=Sedimenticola thiotaurini TaxID=1543721 RepID=A0A0F7JV25_9GAMM|nr:ATP-binding protein [Sedimenticola thiotaurini]AKH19174.1 hypothetical protein AAY24_01120 [Sedimenticola thiotaurini]
MSIRLKFVLFTLGMVIMLIVPIAAGGYWIINRIVFNLYENNLQREITNIDNSIRARVKRLEPIGILSQENFLKAEKGHLIDELKRFQLGETGSLVILDSASNTLLISEASRHAPPPVELIEQARVQDGTGSFTYNSNNEAMFAVFTRSIWNWTIVLTITQAEMLIQRNLFAFFGLLLTLVPLIGVSLLFLIFYHRFYKQISRTLEALKLIEQGRLDTRISNPANNELGEVQTGINSMASTLNDLITNLEQRVNLHTHELRHAKELAEAANRAKGDFLANMSHEIRTPLNGVLGMCQLLQSTEMTQKQQLYLNTIGAAANSLLVIINDILDFSKIEAGELKFEESPFNLSQVLEELSDLMTPAMEQKHLRLIYDTPGDLDDQIIGDSLRIKQVLTNLINNAVKFTQQGQVVLRITLKQQTRDYLVLQFSVEDTGQGIEADQIERLFRPFTQADASTTRRYGGTGLGLSICQRLVNKMGGEISVSSEPGKGSCFSFNATFGRLKHDRKPSGKTAAVLSNKRVALICSDPLTGTIAGRHLKESGCVIRRFASLQEFTDALGDTSTDHGLDILIIDGSAIHSADDLLQPLLQSGQIPDSLPTLLLYDFEDERREIFSQVLKKPLIREKLDTALLETLQPERSSARSRQSPAQKSQIEQLAGMHILLVEDTVLNQQVVIEILDQLQITVSVADNGKTALAMLEEQGIEAFDAIMMDIQMPVMDGFETTRRIRKHPLLKAIPVIAMTANAMSGDRERCLAAGMDLYLTKPINRDQLIQALSQSLRLLEDDTGDTELSEPPSNSVATIDLAILLNRFDGDRPRVLRLLLQAEESFQSDLLQIRRCLEEDDWQGLAQSLHRLKGVAGNMATMGLYHRCATMEAALAGGKTAQLIAHYQELESELDRVISRISALSEQLAAENKMQQNSAPANHTIIDLLPMLTVLRKQLIEHDLVENSTIDSLEQQIDNFAHPEIITLLVQQLRAFNYPAAIKPLDQLIRELELSR